MLTLTVFGKNYRKWAEDYYNRYANGQYGVVKTIAEHRFIVIEKLGDRVVLFSTDDKYSLRVWLDANGLSMGKIRCNGGNGLLGRWNSCKEIELVGR